MEERNMRRTIALAVVVSTILVAAVAASMTPKSDARLKGAFRRPAVNGWTFVHLEGTPAEIGYQHGYLLAPEIQDLYKVYALELTHDNGKDWNFFRDAAKGVLWPRVEQEYREEMQGIVEGVAAQGAKLDIWDLVALNAAMEWSYYVAEYDKARKIASLPTVTAGDHCSAFVAVGSYTKDGRAVIAHNNWSSYLDGARWTMAFDIAPARGFHFIMDGLPGFIHSGDDFGINSAGIVITETTITGFHGFDTDGVPEFVRARKAMQYSASIDDVAHIFKEGNNGGYANDWLIADTHKGEIASLELGLKNVTLDRKTEGNSAHYGRLSGWNLFHDEVRLRSPGRGYFLVHRGYRMGNRTQLCRLRSAREWGDDVDVRRCAELAGAGPLLEDHRRIQRQHSLHCADRDPSVYSLGR